MTAYGGQGLHARFACLQIDQDAVNDYDGVIYQHTHGQDEGSERYALHGAPCAEQEEKRSEHGNDQADADDHATLEAHGPHEDEHYNGHRLDQVDDKGAE